MSYDLYFAAIDENRPAGDLVFQQYFSGRSHYTVSNHQAWYENKDTGVYFSFEWSGVERDAFHGVPDDPSGLLPLSFRLNLLRSHAFALEAAPELESLVREFDFRVYDPQRYEEMVRDFNRREFISSYCRSNKNSVLAVANHSDVRVDTPLRLPFEKIGAIWEWNFNRAEYQESIKDDIFVPGIVLLEIDGLIKTTVVWSDGLCIVLPRVDLVILHKKELVTWKLFRRKPRFSVAMFEELEPFLQEYSLVQRSLPARYVLHGSTPSGLARFIRQKQNSKIPGRGVSFDQVIDDEAAA